MTNSKITLNVLVFLSTTLIFIYLSFVSNFKGNPILKLEIGNKIFFGQPKKTFFDLPRFWQNPTKKVSKTFYEEFSSPEKRSFEDRCLTSFNNSLGAGYFERTQNLQFLKTEEGKEYKKILAYHYGYGKSFRFGFGHEPFEAACCKEKRCFMTNNRSIIPIEEFDAVLMHFRGLKKEDLPKRRKRHQRWILYEKEPPIYSSQTPQKFEGIFNWTMTYKRDSDILSRYGEVYRKRDFAVEDFSNFENLSYSLDDAMKTKNKMVAWLVSNCNAYSRREEYAWQLQRYIQVDKYGKCGLLKCGKRKEDEQCYKKIEREYKFYLSFENIFCKDYITEKFFNILNYYIIPIVRGGGDYAYIAPPHSYINVEDFRLPRDLANYLKYLNENDTAYMEYFKWKKDFFALGKMKYFYHAASFCTLCQKLHSDKEEKIYYNITGWYYQEPQCHRGIKKFSSSSIQNVL